MKVPKFPKITLPSHTPFHALQRFVVLTEKLPGCISWNRETWQPTPKPRGETTPWYVLSFVVMATTIVYICIILHQIVVHEKDPDLSLTAGIVFLIVTFLHALVCSFIVTFNFKKTDICFVLWNLENVGKSWNYIRKYYKHTEGLLGVDVS